MNKSNIVMFRSFIIKDLIAMKYLIIQAFYHFRCNGQNSGCIFIHFGLGVFYILYLLYQVKRKQALLESNLSGIHLMTDEKVKRKEFCFRTPLTFSEVFMPSKTHQ